MSLQTATQMVTIASLPLIVVTLLVHSFQARNAAHQTRILSDSQKRLVYQRINDIMISIDRMFVDRPDLRPYFYSNGSIPDEEPARSCVMAAAEIMVDFIDNFVVQMEVIPAPNRESWIRYFKVVAASSPAIQHFWLTNRHWYLESVQGILDIPCGITVSRS